MPLFRRRGDQEIADDGEEFDSPQADQPANAEAEAAAAEPGRRRPLDAGEVGPDADASLTRLDLGGLRVPVVPGIELRVELNDQRQPIAATLVSPRGAVQLIAFAAPRSEGIWDDVRRELAESVRAGGGRAEEVPGPFGTELRAVLRQVGPDGKTREEQVRFVGFDGPRWFLRATFSGPAATDRAAAELLETLVLRAVVVRGTEPMAPRDPIPLRLPPQAPRL
ncbi:MAG: DUF3710 domain-containing protein [Acidothermus sp.]|nr:DUF3710 domain-containing protein [Acidothermus sp.]MCL6537146.1 DUF3710 domain-containing protein [Acidothermus sp.]